MTTNFVLVHGAWHGGWCWDRVRPLLESRGALVTAPTLTGLDPDFDGTEPPGLADHVGDVMRVIEEADLRNVILVGHSYGGMVTTAVADQLAARIKRLVYLDAAVPRNGDDFASQFPGATPEIVRRRRATFQGMAPDGAWIPVPPPAMIGVTDADDATWLTSRMRPHPLRSWLDPVSLTHDGLVALPKTYIVATNPPTDVMGYPLHGEVAKREKGWTYREIDCGHDAMVLAPERVAALLLEAAQ